MVRIYLPRSHQKPDYTEKPSMSRWLVILIQEAMSCTCWVPWALGHWNKTSVLPHHRAHLDDWPFYLAPSKWETYFRQINRHKTPKTLIFYSKLGYNLTSFSIFFSKVICLFSFLLFNIVFKCLMFFLSSPVVVTAIQFGDTLLSLSHLYQTKEQILSCFFILDTNP